MFKNFFLVFDEGETFALRVRGQGFWQTKYYLKGSDFFDKTGWPGLFRRRGINLPYQRQKKTIIQSSQIPIKRNGRTHRVLKEECPC